jgi:hypothetical protein
VDLCSLPDSAALLFGLFSGWLLQVGTEDCGEVEEVGAVPASLAAMALAPDLELLTLDTANRRVVTMTREFLLVGKAALPCTPAPAPT